MECNHKYPYKKNIYNYNSNCINMNVLNFKDFTKKHELKMIH